MANAKIIRRDGHEESTKIFNDSSPYERLKANEIVEVECEDGILRDYTVSFVHWDFTHFGDTLVIIIEPYRPPLNQKEIAKMWEIYSQLKNKKD